MTSCHDDLYGRAAPKTSVELKHLQGPPLHSVIRTSSLQLLLHRGPPHLWMHAEDRLGIPPVDEGPSQTIEEGDRECSQQEERDFDPDPNRDADDLEQHV